MLFNKNNNGSAEVQLYATWTSDHNYQHLSKSLELAKKKILTIIDKGTWDIAEQHYWGDNYEAVPGEGEEPNPEYLLLDELVHKLQIVLVNFAYSINVYKDSIIWDNSGIKVQWDNEFRPAQQPTLDSVISSLEKDGYQFLDLLIDFLNENKGTFTSFQTSIQADKIKSLFINGADDFSYYFNINNSVSIFFDFLDVISRVQRGPIMQALGLKYYSLCLAYQRKRLEIENCTTSVDTVGDLQSLTPEDMDIALVMDINTYYRYETTDWVFFCENMAEMLALVKPALVDLAMHMKFYSDLKNLDPKNKQVEIIRGNAETLKQAADEELKRLSEFIKKLDQVAVESPQVSVPEISATKNSFMP
jgi:hypothetical protein